MKMVETLSNSSESVNDALNGVDFGELSQVFDGKGTESVLNVEGKEKNREDMNRTEKLVKMQFILNKMGENPSPSKLKDFFNSTDPNYSNELGADFETIYRDYLIRTTGKINGEKAIIKDQNTTADEEPYFVKKALLQWIGTQITEEQKNSK